MRRLAAPLSLVAAGLFARLLSWAAVFQGGRVLFVDTDDYMHLRRMMTAAANFPLLPAADRYLGFPDLNLFRWPPLYDWLGGAVLKLAGAQEPYAAARVAAFFAPLAGALTLWLFWRLCERLMERRAALWALAGAAVLPQSVFYTLLGRPDHHCVENLLLCAALWAAVERKRLLAALALAAGAWCFVGFPAFGALVWLWLLEDRKREDALVFFAQVPLLLPGAWGAEARGGLFAFDTLSLFQPLCALMLGLWLWCAAEWKERRALAYGLAFAGFALGLALARLSTESFALFTAGAPAVFAGFSELQPLLKPGGRWGAENVLHLLGLLPLAAPFAWRHWKKEGGRNARLVLVWAAGTAFLALLQSRYSLHLTLALCALLAPLAARLPAAALVLALPALWNTAKIPLAGASLVGTSDVAQACDFLRERSPKTRSLWFNQGTPEYGVHAHLGLGGAVAALAQRPAPAGNLHWLGEGVTRSLGLYALDSAEEAERLLRLTGFRYVLLDPTPARPDSVAERLYFHDGGLSRRADGSWAPPVDGLRLVFESSGPAKAKVFELVEGKRVSGRCPGKEPVVAETTFAPEGGAPRPWRTFALCERGRYVLRLPYPGRYKVKEGARTRALFIDNSSSKNL